MNSRRHVALALADTFLACDAELPAMVAAARDALGQHWRWIPYLCRALLKRTGEHFHAFSRDELANFILAHPSVEEAWRGPHPPPTIRRYCIEPARQVAPPDWVLPLGLPTLPSHGDLARWLGAEGSELEWFADRRRTNGVDAPMRHYHYRWVAKKSGGFRLIEIPKERLRVMQRQILHQLLARVPLHEAAHGFRRGRSASTHAALHVEQAVVIRMDLQDFFAGIPASRIQALFGKLGYSSSVAGTLARLCTNRVPREVLGKTDLKTANQLRGRHLPQGAPSSPALANLCAFRLDMRLAALATSLGVRYSRYADDLTFSGGADLARAFRRFHIQVTAIACEEGFVVNTRKTRLMNSSTRQAVTGIVVNQRMNIARRDFDRLKAILTNCIRHGPASQNREGRQDFQSHLAGRVAHAQSINPIRGERLHKLFERIA
ncbi:MAG TPA: reverse transcriptase family protein [Burkholderiaceae bacterium]